LRRGRGERAATTGIRFSTSRNNQQSSKRAAKIGRTFVLRQKKGAGDVPPCISGGSRKKPASERGGQVQWGGQEAPRKRILIASENFRKEIRESAPAWRKHVTRRGEKAANQISLQADIKNETCINLNKKTVCLKGVKGTSRRTGRLERERKILGVKGTSSDQNQKKEKQQQREGY